SPDECTIEGFQTGFARRHCDPGRRASRRVDGRCRMSRRPTEFGRIHAPDEAWLALGPAEPIIEPELPIIDTHHHLWDLHGHRYFRSQFLADVATGPNLVASVFMECRSMYRSTGPAAMRPVGETEFVAGQAAMSDSGLYGPMRVAAGIVGFADLTLGDRV